MPPDYKARAEQAILFTVTAWDANCPQHIPVRIDAADANAALVASDARIRALEQEVQQLRTIQNSRRTGTIKRTTSSPLTRR